jgi:RNA polymerase sigma factor (sigma-70 family)
MKTTLGTESAKDEQLVEWSLTGDREAFGRIVERYQSLVCSITYGATGSLSLSEDIAQETFITAWRQLAALSDAKKLRSWLCGIARNLTNNFLRRREPLRLAEPLDTEMPTDEPSPATQAVSREEEAILWRSLERIPDTYREPLILFYREHRSVERVAEELELTEDAVKQRLSRGRRLLADEVAAFVEGALERTTPGRAFTFDVLAASPLAAASTGAAGAGVVAKGAVATKSAGLLPWLVSMSSTLVAMAAGVLVVRAAPTPRERRLKAVFFIVLWAFILVSLYAARPALQLLAEHFQWSECTSVRLTAGFWWVYVAVPTALTVIMLRRQLAIREQTKGQGVKTPSQTRRVILAAVLHLTCFGWMVGWALQSGDRVSAAIIAVAMTVLGVLNVHQSRDKTGLSVVPATARHLALIFGVMVVVLNWRLDVWLAADRGVTLGEMHRLLPTWFIHVLTLALVAWVGVVLAITRPKRPA